MQELYQEWLIDQLNGERGVYGYSELYRIMHDVPFLPVVEMDWNRNDDGLNLALEWAEASYSTDEQIADAMLALEQEHVHIDGFCTMLELTVVLARKMQFELTNSEYDRPIKAWADVLIRNIGLQEYFNEQIEEDWDTAENAIIEILGSVIFRQYGWDGEGGFFPLAYPREDQREEELLNQMNNYIAENYDIC